MSGQTWVMEDSRQRRASLDESILVEFRAELDEFRARIRLFPQQDPAEILATLSGMAGRLSEIRALLYRDNGPKATTLRTREVDPLRDDLEFHFKCHSRRIAVMEFDLRMSGGGI